MHFSGLTGNLYVCRFPVVLSPVNAPEGGAEFHPLIALTVISQPGRARGQTYYPLISFQISKPIQVFSAQAASLNALSVGDGLLYYILHETPFLLVYVLLSWETTEHDSARVATYQCDNPLAEFISITQVVGCRADRLIPVLNHLCRSHSARHCLVCCWHHSIHLASFSSNIKDIHAGRSTACLNCKPGAGTIEQDASEMLQHLNLASAV